VRMFNSVRPHHTKAMTREIIERLLRLVGLLLITVHQVVFALIKYVGIDATRSNDRASHNVANR